VFKRNLKSHLFTDAFSNFVSALAWTICIAALYTSLIVFVFVFSLDSLSLAVV